MNRQRLFSGEDSQRSSFRRQFERRFFSKWLIAALFGLSLFFVIHFREVRVDSLELDLPADRYVVAQIDFDFPDHEATQMRRQEALRDLGKIYAIPEKEIRARKGEIEKEIIDNEDWKIQLPHADVNELFFTLNTFQKGLRDLRLTDPKTIELLKARFSSLKGVEPYDPGKDKGAVFIPDYIWQRESERIFESTPVPNELAAFILKKFQTHPWKLVEDTSLVQKLKRTIEEEIEEYFSNVAAGDRIIDQSERVTTRHLAMIQAMKRALHENRNLSHSSTILGSLILAILFSFTASSYVYCFYPKTFDSNKQLFLLVTLSSLTLGLSKGAEAWLFEASGPFQDFVSHPLFVPLGGILICHLIGPQIATFGSIILSVALTLSEVLDKEGLILNLVASLVAILETRSLRRRKEIFVVSAKAYLACIWVVIGFHLYQSTLFDISFLTDLFSTFFFLLLTAIVVVGVLPLFEATFQIVTDVTLMEYMDPGQELLRRLSIEAPGTYQHSLVVGTLSEAAALSIGANGLFCRVATLYHDIGKMVMPHYFTENQQAGVNVHHLLTPEESAQVVIAHVSEGVILAKKAGLPEPFLDVIKEHHGTSLVWYFYKQFLDRKGGKLDEAEEKLFRYLGPTPRTKEAAIIMMADSFEAASRSLCSVDEASLTHLLEQIVKTKVEDHQLDHCPLTYEEMAILKKNMVQTLLAASHVRIKYPALNEN